MFCGLAPPASRLHLLVDQKIEIVRSTFAVGRYFLCFLFVDGTRRLYPVYFSSLPLSIYLSVCLAPSIAHRLASRYCAHAKNAQCFLFTRYIRANDSNIFKLLHTGRTRRNYLLYYGFRRYRINRTYNNFCYMYMSHTYTQ